MTSINFDSLPDDALIRLSQLTSWGIICFAPATLWRKCRSGDFPTPIKVSPQITAWRVSDIRAWTKDPAGYRHNYESVRVATKLHREDA